MAQLELMRECGKKVEFLGDSGVEKLKPAVHAFTVPDELAEAFFAYHMDFLSGSGGCTNIDGAFFDDEDIKRGIWSKFYHFYWPIVNMIEAKYPQLQFSVNIDPSYDDTTSIVVIAENRYGYDILPVPAAVLNESWKAWHVPFDNPEDPENVYAELEQIYNGMGARMQRATARPHVIVRLEKGVLADTWICYDEREAVALADKIAGERCRDDDGDVLVELPAGTDIHAHSTRIWSWGGGEGD